MKEEKKYPCEQCAFGIYTVEKKWWCNLYNMYAPHTERQRRMKQYAVYVKNGKYWRADKSLHTLKSAKEMVKGLRANGEKAFFSKVR